MKGLSKEMKRWSFKVNPENNNTNPITPSLPSLPSLPKFHNPSSKIDDFNRALELKPNITPEEKSSRQYLEGIAKQSASNGPNELAIQTLFNFLNEIDRRRSTDWKNTFPWLINEFARYSLT